MVKTKRWYLINLRSPNLSFLNYENILGKSFRSSSSVKKNPRIFTSTFGHTNIPDLILLIINLGVQNQQNSTKVPLSYYFHANSIQANCRALNTPNFFQQ